MSNEGKAASYLVGLRRVCVGSLGDGR